MKILFLSDANSPHTLKWAKSLYLNKIDIIIFSLHKVKVRLYDDSPDIKIYSVNFDTSMQKLNEMNPTKINYLKAIFLIKKIIRENNPDIVHAHYASSYGLLGALCGFRPFILSVWGSDVYNFPNYSFLHKFILKSNLNKATKILSTSKVMSQEISKYTHKSITITPFGVDTSKFKPGKRNDIFEKNCLTIGTIKTLEKKYGIKYLLSAFKIVKEKTGSEFIKLLIIGEGTEYKDLISRTKEYNLQNDVKFLGYINHNEIHRYHQMIDIFVSPSIENSESFGVAVIEASACGKPVVVSNVGGLTEVVEDNITGFVVEKENPEALATKIEILVRDSDLREKMGRNGRIKVEREYCWQDSLQKMQLVYNEVLNKYDRS